MRFFIVSFLIFALPACVCAQEVIRKTKVIRGEDYVIDVFYKGEEEIALQRRGADGQKEIEGNLPEGKVKFIDETTGIYGEEYYKRGEKTGICKTYFPSGELMKEMYYINGVLMTEKEFYESGQLRSEADYSRACDTCHGKHEKGAGKLYYRNGRLKYEWNFNSGISGYQKAYTRTGELRFEAHYDREGNQIAR